jgi:putative acyl-CoA dehydrogenase
MRSSATTIGSSALMRMAFSQAVYHGTHRSAFGRRLIEHALMRNVLADLAIEAEASLALLMRVARAVDAAPRDAAEAAFARVATAVGKYWICKRALAFVNEAQECLGGDGYVEESILPRLYRQAPLNSIREGSGNIQCLVVLRALAKEPHAVDALRAELALDSGSPAYRAAVGELESMLRSPDAMHDAAARVLVERFALALQASALQRAGSPFADAFVDSRLGGSRGVAYGTLPASMPLDMILQRVHS